ncbi:MAG: hypothetical protein V7746_20450 [Halioglobus sp.]
MNMIYDHTTQSLYTNHRELIRQFSCPLAKKWNHLSLTSNDYVRYCGSCSKDVLDITDFDERQMMALFEVHPGQCAHLNFDETEETIKIEGETYSNAPICVKAQCDKPVIQTARGIEAINEAIRDGHLVDIRETDVIGAICWNGRWGRGEDGLIRHADQYTGEPCEYSTRYPQGYLGSPLSAYIIPADLKAGTELYVTDVIEHIVERTHHSKYRLRDGTGVWNGESVIIDEPEVEHCIG